MPATHARVASPASQVPLRAFGLDHARRTIAAMRRGTLNALAGLVAAAAVAGCGEEDAETPAACFAEADAYLSALEAAPADVRLEGTTPISDCLVDGQDGGDLGSFGERLVGVATRLNREATEDPAGDSTVELGYLVGAVQEGAAGTGGIHEDLVIRLDAAARFTEGGTAPPAEFERAFGEGYAAGQASG